MHIMVKALTKFVCLFLKFFFQYRERGGVGGGMGVIELSIREMECLYKRVKLRVKLWEKVQKGKVKSLYGLTRRDQIVTFVCLFGFFCYAMYVKLCVRGKHSFAEEL